MMKRVKKVLVCFGVFGGLIGLSGWSAVFVEDFEGTDFATAGTAIDTSSQWDALGEGQVNTAEATSGLPSGNQPTDLGDRYGYIGKFGGGTTGYDSTANTGGVQANFGDDVEIGAYVAEWDFSPSVINTGATDVWYMGAIGNNRIGGANVNGSAWAFLSWRSNQNDLGAFGADSGNISLTEGAWYRLRLEVSVISDGVGGDRRADTYRAAYAVYDGTGALGSYTYFTNGGSPDLASGSTAASGNGQDGFGGLNFGSRTVESWQNPNGAAIDNIEVVLVPEPGTLLLVGLGFVGLLLWRRLRAAAADVL